MRLKYRDCIFISALKCTGFEGLRESIKINIEKHNLAIRVKIPYSDQKIISFIYQKCKVLRREDKKSSIIFDLNIEPKYGDILKVYCMDCKK
jgi:50S ribosomal subunit-associated GTPase HflX